MLEVENKHQFDSRYSLQVDCASALNFVLQQNSVPLIRQILISSVENIADSRIVIRSNPEYFKEHTIHIASLEAHQVLALDKSKLTFDIKLLQELPENIKGGIEVVWLNKQEEILAEQQIEIDLLTIDTWGGERQPIELLASFSQPNASALSPVLVKASEILKAKQLGSLSGYLDRDRDSVLSQLNALWDSLLLQDIHYIVSPASFVKSGQRVRLPKQIFEEKLACCLDTSMLLSALAEQVGLDTLIIIEEGHAYLGVWLNETPNVDLIIDDIQVLRKRYDLGEIVFIETTLLTQQARFASALETAKQYIKDESRQNKFYLALDVRQSRLRGIKPISAHQEKKNHLDETEIEWAPASIPVYDVERPVESKATRVDRWLRRLLDLSLRNKLLNFKDNRYSIPLQCSELTLGKLEDALANQEGFLFKSVDSISLKDVQRENESQHINQYVDESLSRKLLFSPLETPLLEKRLIEVYRASRTALEEGGANTLFLAIGFLEWKESERSKRTFKAPLLLIPVQITRETAKTGYRLFMYDDEPRFNSTLLQLLRQDFELDIAGLNPLPTDDSGVDVNQVLHIVRKAIVNIAGWEVKAEAAIGQFSFSKYLMWLDLSSRMDQLKNQSVVNHLIESPREPFIKQDEFPQPAQLDQQYRPQQLFTPLSSDSSQLAAVMSAALGRTFVLSGPPGTGKSQTITNMISQCLADGKSVLFVSEKMAALEVVYRRLTQIGLSELCLQLHSSKAQKMEVLDQLRERAQKNNDPYFLTAQPQTTGWQKLSDRLIQTRDELNQHVKNLHISHAIGWSLYAAMSDELRYRDTPHLRFPEINIATLTVEKRELLNEIVTQAVSLRQLVNENAKDILDGFAEGLSEPIWSLAWQEQYQLLQDQFVGQIQQLQKSIFAWQQAFGFGEKQNLSQLKQDVSIFRAISDLVQQIDLKLLSAIKDIDLTTITQAKQLSQDLKQQRSILVGQYQPQIYQADLNQIAFKWREAEAKIFPFSWFAKFQLRNLVKTYQSSAQRPTALVVAHDLPILQHIQSQQRKFTECENQLATQLGSYWQGEDSAWQSFETVHNQWQEIKQVVATIITDQAALLKAVEFSKNHGLEEVVLNIAQVENTFSQLLNDYALQKDVQVTPYSDIHFNEILERQQQLQQYVPAWRHWLNWQAIKSQLIKNGLKPLAFELLHAPLELNAALKRLNINLARHWITHQFSQHPELNQFNSQQHEQKIQSFAQQDKQHQLAASQEIIHRWNGIFAEQSQYKGQWTVLNKELGKKRRHIPVRELMRQISDVLVGLKPCLLMSPLSVAQYLDTEAKFDVVIFDEASQIPVWDAIGALARGKQSIVVGDNKQMPPTSFFGKGDSEEEVDEEVTEDLESILDECLAAQLPELALNWHYRSRYESLIQFSNQKYYKGGLFTFPAPVAKDTAVKLHMVEGVYDKGDTRTNANEAKAIVEFIIQHLQSQVGQKNPLTLGVVTFNMTQQKLIEDLLDNELTNHPELEALSKSGIEPLFVKNLENVQGDERDIIVFSITYAKDQDGRLSMNFGALNRQGGQRRLNVAITRARQGLHVFSALSPEEINLARTNSEGVRDLKDFLVFARSGQLHLNYADRNQRQAKKELVQYLQTKLQEQGWNVDAGIGQGDSCVDLAVRDDLHSGNYIAGILVDGENYAKAATARDRDQLRPTVLNGLGWEVLSVWTVDWWLDPEQNLSKLIKSLEEIKVNQNVA
ncbi:DUF4011 domain-containing protein [Acinetobacter sp. VNH17]|uniref:DUF4011 domain-containing protein n=1 Tax=Acinetobacter thutiue TaxID=2998078 RepID=A0ABT7WM04_9GAMM|nr:DUF4011 domain-containing protein [Acinetobacter thutiue]MCY6411609.1 DUF4011 domain-containing protein [Acinetobacter thutiue]MDN0013711.1 DUF4011 domain-containing protein [Acinetobacter thutiue]